MYDMIYCIVREAIEKRQSEIDDDQRLNGEISGSDLDSSFIMDIIFDYGFVESIAKNICKYLEDSI